MGGMAVARKVLTGPIDDTPPFPMTWGTRDQNDDRADTISA